VKNPALLYEVSFFSALWMVFPESWKRSCPNFYAHDCRCWETGVGKQVSGNRCLDSFWKQVLGNRCLETTGV
jgi:hypothetical protein